MSYNSDVDEFAATEYPMLEGRTYLDHGGATIYAKSLIEKVSADLIGNLYGNPHSECDPAALSGQLVDETREKTLRFFGADPEHFDLIFVANATAAIKMVMESFKDLSNAAKNEEGYEKGFKYYYHVDCHNSVIGVRETTEDARCFKNDEEVEDWLEGRGDYGKNRLALFAYPGQSNMTGRRLPLSWTGRLRASTLESNKDTYSLLDAAALATTAPLAKVFANPDTAPDFTSVSFYKIFGYPDLGGLIVRKKSGNILRWGRKYFGGGTVDMVVVLGKKTWYQGRKTLHEGLEDGTLPFHNIISLNAAIDTHTRLYGEDPMSRISKHATFLGKRLYDGMSSLVHPTGVPLVAIYNENPDRLYGNAALQGGTVAFNLVDPQGIPIPYTSVVESLANDKKIYLRAGSLCNPGGLATYLGYDPIYQRGLLENGHTCGNGVATGTEVIKGRATGVVRASLGAMTTMNNVDTLLAFLEEEFMSGAEGTYSSTYAVPSVIDSEQISSSRRQQAQQYHQQHVLRTISVDSHSIPPSYASKANSNAGSNSPTRVPSVDQMQTQQVVPFKRLITSPVVGGDMVKAVQAMSLGPNQRTVGGGKRAANVDVDEKEKEKRGLKAMWRNKVRKSSSGAVFVS